MKTKVLFRSWQGEVVALFPAVAGDMRPGNCQSYQHVGQHGAADCQGIIRDSRPATPKEYRPLAQELRRIGYRLDIRQRETRKDYEARKAQINEP